MTDPQPYTVDFVFPISYSDHSMIELTHLFHLEKPELPLTSVELFILYQESLEIGISSEPNVFSGMSG